MSNIGMGLGMGTGMGLAERVASYKNKMAVLGIEVNFKLKGSYAILTHYNNWGLTGDIVTLPEFIGEIGELAFNNQNIAYIRLDKNIKFIHRSAFSLCNIGVLKYECTKTYPCTLVRTNIDRIVLGKQIKSIVAEWIDRSNIGSIENFSQVKTIHTQAFNGTNIKCLWMDKGVFIEEAAFVACSIENLVIHTFYDKAFLNCTIRSLTLLDKQTNSIDDLGYMVKRYNDLGRLTIQV